MQNKTHCKVLVAPRMEIVGRPSWTPLLGVIAEAVNIARSDGVVQILQNISVNSENEEKELEDSEKYQIVVDAYSELLATFGDHEPLKLKSALSRESIFVMTIVRETPEGVPC
ncbi:MAG: hypothetical protein P1P90_03720 [Patescibacteria group bacterium]|nr:hypothetical protein [Patescibacteria group bacterium]